MWEGVSAWAVGGDVARAFGHVQAGGEARVHGVSLCARTHSHSSCTRTQAAGRVSWGHGDNIYRWAKFDTLSELNIILHRTMRTYFLLAVPNFHSRDFRIC